MVVKGVSAVAILILILSCNPSIQSGSLQQVKVRDLSRYDKAGPYELKLYDQASADAEVEVREFLWDHWHQRRLGYVVATYYSTEGEPSTFSYFVEPDARGAWCIAVKINRTVVDRGGSKNKYYQTVEYDASIVERIEVPKDGLTQRVVIPEAEVRSATMYRLVLKDQEGKPLTEI